MKRWAALLLAVAAGGAAADKRVPLCVTDFPPYVSAALPDGGSITALARRAFEAGGLGVQHLHVPWVRAFAMARNGDCLLLSLWRNEERDALFLYSLPVMRMELGLFVRADLDTPLPPDATVAYQRGSYLPPALADGRYQLYELVDPRPGLEMLRRRRVDAVLSERATFEHLLAAQPRGVADDVRWQAPAIEVKNSYIAISRHHPQAEAWLALLNREIRRQPGQLIRN